MRYNIGDENDPAFNKSVDNFQSKLEIAMTVLEIAKSFVLFTDPSKQEWPVNADSKKYVLDEIKNALKKLGE